MRPVDRDLRISYGAPRLDLALGAHRVEVGLFSADWSETVHEIEPMDLAVRGEGPDTASLAPPYEWRRGARND